MSKLLSIHHCFGYGSTFVFHAIEHLFHSDIGGISYFQLQKMDSPAHKTIALDLVSLVFCVDYDSA